MSAFWWPSWLKRPEPKPVNVTVHVKADIDPRKVAEAVRREMLTYARRNGATNYRIPGRAWENTSALRDVD